MERHRKLQDTSWTIVTIVTIDHRKTSNTSPGFYEDKRLCTTGFETRLLL